MARVVLLDSGPLGLAAMPVGKPPGDALRSWLTSLEAAGNEILIPAVADYEVRRELIRVGLTASVQRLDALKALYIYLPVREFAWDRASEFWAIVRRAGVPTAGPRDLDADAILAGQAATAGQPGDVVTIATTNARHLNRFPGIDAKHWSSIH